MQDCNRLMPGVVKVYTLKIMLRLVSSFTLSQTIIRLTLGVKKGLGDYSSGFVVLTCAMMKLIGSSSVLCTRTTR